tara:strand:- start:79 stop:378 length:300 start_codon:yes stop_codon:yes gene_type:complete
MNMFRPSQPYVDKPKKVKESPLSTGFEQKDYKDKEETIEYNPGELMMGMTISGIGLMASTALTLHRYFNDNEWKPMLLIGVVSFAYLVTTIKEYNDPTN